MPNDVGTSIERVSQDFDAFKRCKFLWLLLTIMAIASTSNAQPVANPTVNKPRVATEAGTNETVLKRCSEVAPDAEYLIPRTAEFHGRIEASGSGAYAYKPSGDCRYWVTDFLMNQNSHTWLTEAGAKMREYVLFSGDAFDLPSSTTGDGTRPSVEEDCKRLEVDVLVFRKDPNENTFKLVKSGKGRFASWNGNNKVCNMQGLPDAHTERAPTANMLKIRIAVRVKLRDSWQQAAGYAKKAPPN